MLGGSLDAHAVVPGAAELAEGEADFLGPPVPVHIAQGIAEGRLHPVTYETLPGSNHHGPSMSEKLSAGGGGGALSAGNGAIANVGGGGDGFNGGDDGIPPVHITTEAMQRFKRPRLASEGASQQSQKARPLAGSMRQNPNLPAALTARRYFPTSTSSGGNEAAAAAIGVTGGPLRSVTALKTARSGPANLRTTLQTALLACNSNNNSGNNDTSAPPSPPNSNEDRSQGDEAGGAEKVNLSFPAEHVLPLTRGLGTKVDPPRKRLGEGDDDKLGVGPLWRPKSTCWATPAPARTTADPAMGVEPRDGTVAPQLVGLGIVHETPVLLRSGGPTIGGPQGVTPGFYATDPISESPRCAPGSGAALAQHGAITGSPRQLTFPGEEGDAIENAAPVIDLRHLPAVAEEAAAAVEAAVEQANEDADRFLIQEGQENNKIKEHIRKGTGVDPLPPQPLSQQERPRDAGPSSNFNKFACRK